LAKIYQFGLVDHRVGSGRRRSTRRSLCTVQQPLLVSGAWRRRCSVCKASDAHFEYSVVFDSDITLLASFVTNNTSCYEPTIFFVIFVNFGVVKYRECSILEGKVTALIR